MVSSKRVQMMTDDLQQVIAVYEANDPFFITNYSVSRENLLISQSNNTIVYFDLTQ